MDSPIQNIVGYLVSDFEDDHADDNMKEKKDIASIPNQEAP